MRDLYEGQQQGAKSEARRRDNETTDDKATPLEIMRDYTKDSSKEQGAKREGLARLRPRRPHWRFEDLEIWNRAAELAVTPSIGSLTASTLAGYTGMRSIVRAAGSRFPTT